MKKTLGLIAGPALFLYILFFFEAEGLNAPAKAVLASTLWISLWWVTEAIPIEATSLLPIILFPLTGAVNIESTTAAYGNKIIFLFLGGFILASAMERWNLHKRIALKIILLIGTNPRKVILGFMIATGFISMWISNTAATLMMLPIAFAVVSQLSDFLAKKLNVSQFVFIKPLLLGVAYAASIGGIGTLVGTPTNAVFAGIVGNLYQIEISFYQWFIYAMPFAAILLLLCWAYMTMIAYPIKKMTVPGIRDEIKRDYDQLGPIHAEEVAVLIVFIITAAAWISRTFLLEKIIPGMDDSIIAIGASVTLFVLPSRSIKGARILDWETAVKLPWGILLLFGGGLAIAVGFSSTGLAAWIGNQLSMLNGISLIVVMLLIVGLVNFLTEITSNVATATMILPIVASFSMGIGVHPLIIMAPATIAASCAFMLPVATPPNAIVFGTGKIRIIDMVKTGFVLNIMSVIVATLYTYWLLPLLWNLQIFDIPMIK